MNAKLYFVFLVCLPDLAMKFLGYETLTEPDGHWMCL